MECNLVWNHTRHFKIERTRSASSIWNHKYDLRPKLHDPKFNCHFIRSILKSHNFFFRFLVYCSSSRFVKKSGTGNAFTSHLVRKTMSCNENSFEHDKETSSSEVRTKIVYFRYKSSILVTWINYGRPSFLLWLRLRLLSCETFEADFFWVVKLPRVHDAQWIVRFFLLKTLQWHDFKGVQLVIISVSFCDLRVRLNTQDLVKFLRRHLF